MGIYGMAMITGSGHLPPPTGDLIVQLRAKAWPNGSQMWVGGGSWLESRRGLGGVGEGKRAETVKIDSFTSFAIVKRPFCMRFASGLRLRSNLNPQMPYEFKECLWRNLNAK